jgi:hypothetical protein
MFPIFMLEYIPDNKKIVPAFQSCQLASRHQSAYKSKVVYCLFFTLMIFTITTKIQIHYLVTCNLFFWKVHNFTLASIWRTVSNRNHHHSAKPAFVETLFCKWRIFSAGNVASLQTGSKHVCIRVKKQQHSSSLAFKKSPIVLVCLQALETIDNTRSRQLNYEIIIHMFLEDDQKLSCVIPVPSRISSATHSHH